MSVQRLGKRLEPLFKTHKQTVHLIQRLPKLPTIAGSSSTDPEAGDARLELSAEIHQSLKEQEEDLEILRQEVEDQLNTASWTSATRRKDSEKERERTDLAAQVARLEHRPGTDEDGDIRARSQFRKAQLQAKRNAEVAKRKERELLFAGVQEGNITSKQGRRRGQEQLSKEQVELTASADVTAALRRVHSLMQSEVSRSQFALETLREFFWRLLADHVADCTSIDQSTTALSSLSESYTNLDTLLASSRSLVSTLLHSQKSDTWYLESAFWLLVATIAWLFFRRILYGPGWWLLYLPTSLVGRLAFSILRLFLGSSAAIFGAVGAKSQSRSIIQASSSISSNFQEHPIATEEIPRFQAGMTAPTIQVGGGGKSPPPDRRPGDEKEGVSKTVGEMAEKGSDATASSTSTSQQTDEGTILRERETDEPPNPKKRMWEEAVVAQEGSGRRDKL
ncbi:MAG: hypothetical protein Q9174_000416 [Haloplaca sp. 1 TL-2023]